MGKTALGDQHRLQRRAKRGTGKSKLTAARRRSMVALSAFFPSKCRLNSSPLASFPSRRNCVAVACGEARLTPGEFDSIVDKAREIGALQLFHRRDRRSVNSQLAARARRLKRQRGLDLIVVDYIQLLQGSSAPGGRKPCSRSHRNHDQLKALAKELNIPIVALSQLSRQVENSEDKRPQLSDLRESGSIEQDADVVMFVFQRGILSSNQKPREGSDEFLKWNARMEKAHGKAEVIIGKQRHGPTGTVQLQFKADVTRFADLADNDHSPARLAFRGRLSPCLKTSILNSQRDSGRRHSCCLADAKSGSKSPNR